VQRSFFLTVFLFDLVPQNGYFYQSVDGWTGVTNQIVKYLKVTLQSIGEGLLKHDPDPFHTGCLDLKILVWN